jgi:hypothetical protein
MVHQPTRIDFDQFATDPGRVFDQVRRRNQPIIVVRDGEAYRLAIEDPRNIWEGYDAVKAQQDFRRATGILADVDRVELLRDIHEQREQAEGRFD